MIRERSQAPTVQMRNFNFSFGAKVIFKELTLELFSGDKVVLVGENGIGKSTLLKIASGYLKTEDVEIAIRGSIGYLPQTFEDYNDQSVVEFFIYRSGSDELKKILEKKEDQELWVSEFNAYGGHFFLKDLRKLGLENFDLNKKLGHLSGGEKTKILLASLAFLNPDILLLDEPTNHLDERGITWLEHFLKRYMGIMLMTTHDRILIDRTANRIAEISHETHQLTYFRGGYTNYLAEQGRNRERLLQQLENQERELKILSSKLQKANISANREVYRSSKNRDKLSFNAHGERKQKSAAKTTQQLRGKIDHIENDRIKVPKKRGEISINIENAHSGSKDSIQFENISKKMNGVFLFSNLSFLVQPLERLIVHGKNGSGKTTFLKIIAGLIQPDSGKVFTPFKEKIGFLDQEQETLNLSLTPIELLLSDKNIELSKTNLIAKLMQFGIYRKEDLFLPLQFLSIGSRRKVQLAQIVLRGCDVLLLDEPTNHFDLPSLEYIEAQLLLFPGPIIAVTHDRYFRNKIATHELILEHYK
ncbi:MAG: ABC-F family ATP-binding cassette domain-containing protein [Candidatus Rhabdochlamydia sp.]